ncbi:MAG: NAD-binding protein [Lachnospiraceae bacterium]|nr:NAD-binding protein [Lachnospiraceae bacterium]
MSKIVVVGAGKTGRGFIARLLQEANEDVIFVDKDETLVNDLNASGEFKVSFFGNVREAYQVSNFKACTWETADLEDAELILVSVGGQNLKDVGESLSKLLKDEKHYYIITAENASHPSKTLREAIGKDNISVSESTVFCTTIEDGGLNINSENYPYLQCDADLLEGYVPAARTLKPIGNFSNFLTRKLYTYNAASCVIAYLGWKKGYSNYADAANDEEILELLDKNYEVTNRVLCKEFGYEEEDQKEFAALSKAKFCDRTIVDTVARNARDPQRKLGGAERIIGPIKLMHKYGEDASVLEQTAAAAILYDNDGEDAWRVIKAEKTVGQILTDICGLEESDVIYQNIVKYL